MHQRSVNTICQEMADACFDSFNGVLSSTPHAWARWEHRESDQVTFRPFVDEWVRDEGGTQRLSE